MNDPIVFTPADVVQMVSSITALIIAINAVALIFISWYKRAHKPEEVQNERLNILESRVDELERGHRHMKDDFEESKLIIRSIERDNYEFQKVVVKGIQALTEHALNGDSSEALHKSQEAISDYLIKSKGVQHDR